ncbi:Multiple RNA-binding domain-containing protein 1 [Pleurotus ostreatus]|uniref:Multiple RNA-binding domain-containing protein 1 n=1 Tax=Pleurotus ostreatus TaxID=5322 RepID=A0A8H6ZMB6_PLEOS|nr:Multiple RNA-binding domain-containing protein 1 [Pleurotus ostreatus]KAF7421208.1 Multiple RNA-binding domain-containing protein 1 [Pleurotus ostreatus]
MSRLIVKNLPTYVTPAQLRKHFEQKGAPGGIITDVKVSSKSDGTSRRFGFVGFKSDLEAEAAKTYFDRTFIDSTRINVMVVDVTKDAPRPRPNKRPRLDPSPDDDTPSKHIKVREHADSATDDKLEEFLDVMRPRTAKGPLWANDEGKPRPGGPIASVEPPLPEPIAQSPPREGEAGKDEPLSDLEWMRRRMSSKVDVAHRAFEQDDEVTEKSLNEPTPAIQVPPSPASPHDVARDTILQTGRLFVRNLTFSCTQEEVETLFKPYGDIAQVHIPLDSLTKQSKGLAYVTFRQSSCALAAFEALDRKSFQGRLLHILPAVDRKGNIQIEEGSGRKKTVKDERNQSRKSAAGKEFNWSMLYMNSDAVASSVASRMNISKSEILNPESDNAAVKLALAETHIISETKTYLESQGVILESFAARARSDTTILVKNIPFGTTVEQIREMFEQHGSLARVLVPPAGTMAVVDFEHPDEAQKAFKAIAYRRLGNSIIYLEKGPQGMFLPTSEIKASDGGHPPTSAAIRIIEQEQEAPQEDAPSLAAGTTLFVKNLAFSTTSERLTQVFRHLPSFSFARVQTKPDPKKPGKDAPRLSMGYGFVGFKDVEGAQKALKSMQDYVLDGHALHVKFAGRGQEEAEDAVKGGSVSKGTTTKIIVKNVPFEATKKDVRALFSAHGQLKSVRVPKRFDARSRGFAFLDFVSRHEAENAYNALKHTHLLGRHLVLQWAEEGEDLEMMRQKAGAGFGGGAEMPGRKRKLNLGGDKDAIDVDGLDE